MPGPTASIFVWSIEGGILSLVWLSYSLTMRGLFSLDGGTAVLDLAYSSVLVAAYTLTIIAHTTIIVMKMPPEVHCIASSAQCSLVCCVCATYVCWFLDACVLGDTDMCSVLFRGIPFPLILGGVISGLSLVLLFTSIALAVVCQDNRQKPPVPALLLLPTVILYAYTYAHAVGASCDNKPSAGIALLLLVLALALCAIHCVLDTKWTQVAVGVYSLVVAILAVVQLLAGGRVAAALVSLVLALVLVAVCIYTVWQPEASVVVPAKMAKYSAANKDTDSSSGEDEHREAANCSIFISDDVRSSLALRQRVH